MPNRSPIVELDEDDDSPLFVKDGRPVKFCFHQSVTQGRGKITQDIERHGGRIVRDERHTNVLLVDEQQDVALIRRRYYHSNELYRLSIYVEPRGFVQKCIRSRSYHHVPPRKEGMPGRAPGGGRRVRVAFTDEDRDELAHYLATRFPTKDGRMGNSAYKDLVRLGETDDPTWAWARRHTFHSWREHYKMNPVMMDARIDNYLNQLKNVGHHYGHDPRRHDWRREEEEEEEEEEGEGQPEGQGRERRERVRPAVAAARRRDYLALNVQDLQVVEDSEEEEEEVVQGPQRHRRHAQHPRDVQRAKRARLSRVSPDDRRTSTTEAGPSAGSSGVEKGSDYEGSQGIEGSDLFGDRDYGEDALFDHDDFNEFHFSMRSPPRAPSVLEQDEAPLSTQATLVAAPATDKEPKPEVPPPQLAGPPSSQPTLVMTRERVVVQHAHVRGASARPGPSVPKEMGGGTVVTETPLRDARVRSRSVDVQPAPEPQRVRQGWGKGKGKGNEYENEVGLTSIEENIRVEEESKPRKVYMEDTRRVSATNGLSARSTFEEEMAVEEILEEVDEGRGVGGREAFVGGPDETDETDSVGDDVAVDEDGNILPGPLPYQDIVIDSPSDSDDAETHGSLIRGAVREGVDADAEPDHREEALDVGEEAPDQGQDRDDVQESDEDDADAERIERMARGSLHTVRASVEPRVTRSMAATQVQMQMRSQTRQVSPRRTRSETQSRSNAPTTKAHAPPVGSRTAKTLKEKGWRT